MAGIGSGAREKLEKAYFELIEQVHYSEIRVSDIISRANVSRTTFYRHYVDIFDMHKKVSSRLADSIMKECFAIVKNTRDRSEYYDKIMEIFYARERYIRLVAGKNGSRYFFDHIYLNTQKLFNFLKIIFSEEQLFRLKFMTMAAIGSYMKSIIDEKDFNPECIELSKKLINFEKLLGDSDADNR